MQGRAIKTTLHSLNITWKKILFFLFISRICKFGKGHQSNSFSNFLKEPDLFPIKVVIKVDYGRVLEALLKFRTNEVLISKKKWPAI